MWKWIKKLFARKPTPPVVNQDTHPPRGTVVYNFIVPPGGMPPENVISDDPYVRAIVAATWNSRETIVANVDDDGNLHISGPKTNTNDESFEKSFTHTRPEPDTNPPTSRITSEPKMREK